MFEKAITIAQAETTRLDELMKIADGDPRSFWIGADFRQVDVADIDVNGWCFHAADLTNCDFSQVKNIDKATFTKETILAGVILPKGMKIADLVFEKIP